MNIVSTSSSDELQLTGFLSETSASKDIIVHIHGMGGDPYTNGWYPTFHKEYPNNNIAFLVGNHRGTGSITMFKQGNDKYPNYGNALETMEDSAIDIDAWVQYAVNLGYQNIHIQAHSLAPSKVVNYLNNVNHNYVKSLILISPCDMLGLTIYDQKLHNQLFQEARELVKSGKGDQLLSQMVDGDYYMSAKTYLNFFSDNSSCNIFCYTDRKHDWSKVNQITQPVLLIGGTNDSAMETLINSLEGFEILKKQLTNSSMVHSIVYENADHSFDGFEGQIVKDVVAFINSTSHLQNS